jgi:FKBP-type peptidyl-prolyl cis-trans isomerase FklB
MKRTNCGARFPDHLAYQRRDRNEHGGLPGLRRSPRNVTMVYMHKSFTAAVTILAAGMLLGNALAQQTPAATTPPASPSPASSAQAQTPAAKPHSATAAKTAAPLTLKTQKDKFSYALGMNTGKRMSDSLKKQSVPFDPAILVRGMRDAMTGGKTLLTDEEAQAVLTEMQKQVREQQQAKMQQAGQANKKDGEAFLAANKGKEGIVVLPSGLQYKILKEGTGPKPAASDSVVCNYKGTLINGTEFDSSYKRGQPATFPVGGVIKGWTEALQLMPVGSKWQLFIPSDLAYGEHGAGADIGPDATLIFEVELLSIEDKSKDKTPGKDKDKDKDQEKK